MPTLAPAAAERRRERHRRRSVVRRVAASIAKGAAEAGHSAPWSTVPFRRCAGCGVVNVDDLVSIKVRQGDDGPTAFVSGVSTCGSVWSCAVCSATIRSRRSIEVSALAVAHSATGGTLGMLTLTVRHSADNSLSQLLQAEGDVYRSLQQDKRWRALVRPNLVGIVRSWEITHGFFKGSNGSWHPHFHVLLLWKAGFSADDQAQALAWIQDTWADRIERRLGLRPNDHGCDYRAVSASAAEYVSKIGHEMSRADMKGRSAQVWQLIDAMENGERWATDKFVEYVTATKGRRAIQFSRGLRALYGIDELTDEEIAALELEGEVVERIAPKAWRAMCEYAGWQQAPASVRRLEYWERLRAVAPPPPLLLTV